MRRLLTQVSCVIPVGVIGVFLSGCLTLKAEHNDLAARVIKLEQQSYHRGVEFEQKLTEAEKRLAALQGTLEEAEKLLRGNQAGIGVRMENIELALEELRGAADQTEFAASAVEESLRELRADIDQRVAVLEQKLNEENNIPEGRNELYEEAERQLKQKSYKNARRLFRTYISRYPKDDRLAQAKFNVGLTFYSERDYKSSLGEFYRIIQDDPNSSVIPDALYYSGLSFAKIGQCKNATAYFEAILKLKNKASSSYRDAAKNQIDLIKKDKGDLCFDDHKSASERKSVVNQGQ